MPPHLDVLLLVQSDLAARTAAGALAAGAVAGGVSVSAAGVGGAAAAGLAGYVGSVGTWYRHQLRSRQECRQHHHCPCQSVYGSTLER